MSLAHPILKLLTIHRQMNLLVKLRVLNNRLDVQGVTLVITWPYKEVKADATTVAIR
jgi:hypothetical protein